MPAKKKPARRKVSAKRKGTRPHILEKHESDFRLDYVTGQIGPKEIAEKYGTSVKNTENYLRTRGITDMRRQYKAERIALAETADKQIEAAAREAQLAALIKEREGEAIDHQKWLSLKLKSSRDRLDTDAESATHLDKSLDNLKKIADLAREHYGLDNRSADDHAQQVHIIMNLDAGDIKEKPAQAHVLDV